VNGCDWMRNFAPSRLVLSRLDTDNSNTIMLYFLSSCIMRLYRIDVLFSQTMSRYCIHVSWRLSCIIGLLKSHDYCPSAVILNRTFSWAFTDLHHRKCHRNFDFFFSFVLWFWYIVEISTVFAMVFFSVLLRMCRHNIYISNTNYLILCCV